MRWLLDSSNVFFFVYLAWFLLDSYTLSWNGSLTRGNNYVPIKAAGSGGR